MVKTGDHREEVALNILHPGEAFDERALLQPGGRRTATVRAYSSLQLLQLDRAVFNALVRTEPRAYLRQGDFFGEVSLLRGTHRTASVEAVTDAELWALAPEVFAQLVAEQPKFRERIDQRIASYDYRRVARVPLDFAEELLPADAAGPEVLAEEQTGSAAEEYAQQPDSEVGAGGLAGFVWPRQRIRRSPRCYSSMRTGALAGAAATRSRVCGGASTVRCFGFLAYANASTGDQPGQNILGAIMTEKKQQPPTDPHEDRLNLEDLAPKDDDFRFAHSSCHGCHSNQRIIAG